MKKCTCKHRNPLAAWNDSAYPHEESCPLTARLKAIAEKKATTESIHRLFSHYQRQAKGDK